MPDTLYQSRLVDNERADASCQGCTGQQQLCRCLWMWSLVFTLVFHGSLSHSSDLPTGFYREIKLCLTLDSRMSLAEDEMANDSFVRHSSQTWALARLHFSRGNVISSRRSWTPRPTNVGVELVWVSSNGPLIILPSVSLCVSVCVCLCGWMESRQAVCQCVGSSLLRPPLCCLGCFV